MGGAADEGVGRVGESVEHVLPDKSALFGFHQWLQKVVDHLSVHGPLMGQKNKEQVAVQFWSKFQLNTWRSSCCALDPKTC